MVAKEELCDEAGKTTSTGYRNVMVEKWWVGVFVLFADPRSKEWCVVLLYRIVCCGSVDVVVRLKTGSPLSWPIIIYYTCMLFHVVIIRKVKHPAFGGSAL